ncbi:hypothetical protein BPAE_0251g00040 [Botrytis paeoniae]|uniref:Uncharacterized protein n=1 Tax=Botrytis paeoniae TaxID=278948 RepID=A0A4Z1FHI1_9HELO|nr:hypothetical protein BPAE_0251g00040 [Botrytis paeoniae]
MAALMAAVSSVEPSPLAPKSLTFAKDLESTGVWIEGCNALVFDILEPVATRKRVRVGGIIRISLATARPGSHRVEEEKAVKELQEEQFEYHCRWVLVMVLSPGQDDLD